MVGWREPCRRQDSSTAASGQPDRRADALSGAGQRVIFLFMNGAPSHVDTFDPKPALGRSTKAQKPAGELFKAAKRATCPLRFAFTARRERRRDERTAAEPGALRRRPVRAAVMHTNVPNHEPGLLIMNSGNQQPIRP